MSNFSAQVKGWADKTKKAQEHIFRMSVQKLADEILLPKERGGNMPVDTGNLRRSLLASTSAMPAIRSGSETFSDNSGQIALVVGSASANDTLYLGFQAAYARRMEYGFVGEDSLGRNYNQAGNHFVSLAVQKWQQIVDKAVKEYGD